MRRSLEVAERCNVELELGRIRLPRFPVPEGRDAFDYLVELCEKGLVKRYGASTPELDERLRFELKTVREMGFADYFLIVADFIGFAKRNGVSVGPGRGSAAGSLAAYCLEITDIDPMRYGLLFERFLNPARKDMPDMDIDFAVEGRERVINYVTEKYGRDRVAQIITFSKMAARAALRDAGRVLEIPYGVVDRDREARPGRPRPDARGRAQARPGAREGRRERPRREGDRRPRPPARGPDPRRLDPRRRRRDRLRAADRRRPAPAEGRRRRARDAVLDEERRGARPPQGRLPRPAQPRRDRQGGRADRRRPRHRHDPARRPQDVRDARAGRRDRRLPVRVVGDEGRAPAGEADGLRGPDRPRRALPPRPDAVHPHLRRAEERQGAGAVRRPAARGDHRRHVRDLDLPGAVDGDREADRGLHRRRGRDAAPRDRQEDPRADGLAQGQVPRRLRRERRHPGGRRAALEGHGGLEGLLLQQGARRLLRADRLPHRVAQGEPSVRVHGRAHLERDEHEGPRPLLRQRLRRDGDRGAAARRQLVRGRLRGRRGEDPLRPERGEERGGDRGAAHRRRARGGRPVRVDLGLHRARRPAGRQQALARVARQVRRARLDRRDADGDARRPRAGARPRAEARAGPADGPVVALRRRLRHGRQPARAPPPADPDRRVREGRAPAAREGDARPLRLRAPALDASASSSGARPTQPSPSSSAAATARSSPSAGSSPT